MKKDLDINSPLISHSGDTSNCADCEGAANSSTSRSKRILRKCVCVVAIMLTLYQLYTAIFGLLPPLRHRSIHVGAIIAIIFFLAASDQKTKKVGTIAYAALGVISLAVFSYIAVSYERLLMVVGFPSQLDIAVGCCMVVLVLLATRKRLGWAVPIICCLFLAYALLGPQLPGRLAHKAYSIKRISAQLMMGTEGVFGTIAGTSATYIFLFCFFGTLLDVSGAADFFINFAISLTGKSRGGGAKIACLSSGLFGMVSGSAAANVVTTGTFTIPLMKKSGYSAEFAGAVEAVSSTGGQLMPPIMGAAAFIIAETLGTAYINVVSAAIVPAVLYYVTVWTAIDLRARKQNIGGVDGYTTMEKPLSLLKRQGYMLIPLLMLIYGLSIAGWSAMKAGVYSCVCLIILAELKKETRFTFKMVKRVLEETALSVVDVAIVCAAAGIISGTLSLTGLGVSFSGLLVHLAGGHKLVLLVLAAVAALILGMGMTTSSVYIILSVLVCPALITMDVPPMVAHLFVFYFGILSNITPPVAVASFAAASIAQTDSFKLGFTAWRLGFAGYLLPFLFVYGNELCLMGSAGAIIKAIVTALCGIFCLSCALEGYWIKNLAIWQRLLLGVAAVACIDTRLITDIAGLLCAAVVFLPLYLTTKKHETVSANESKNEIICNKKEN